MAECVVTFENETISLNTHTGTFVKHIYSSY